MGVLVYHPVLFAILPMLEIWRACMGSYMPEQYLAIISFLTVATLSVQFICWKIFNDPYKAGLLATLTVACVFCWPMFRGITHLPPLIEVSLYLLLFLNAGWLAVKKAPAKKLSDLLNTASLAVLAVAVPVMWDEWHLQAAASKETQSVRKQFADVKLIPAKSAPDVYYIIADAFANPNTLKEQYSYDSLLVKQLRDRGFFVAEESFSNHDRTALSVPSSLNMRYMMDLVHDNKLSTQSCFRLMQNNEVAYLLGKAGYRFINVSSGWEPTDLNPFADENDGCLPGCNFQINLLRLTVLEPFVDQFGWSAELYRMNRLRCLREANATLAAPGPKFVFIHSMVFHPPFFLDEDGKVTSLSKRGMNEPYTKAAYLKQLKFGEKQLSALISRILASSKTPPIIIVQSDHGPGSNTAAYAPDYANERMRILNAYYLCGPHAAVHPPISITPVNSFRWLFNNYFGTSLPMLPEQSYAAVPFEGGVHREITKYIRRSDQPIEGLKASPGLSDLRSVVGATKDGSDSVLPGHLLD